MAIESGFALAQVLQQWRSTNLGDALQFFQDLRKPRTDRITKTSYETGKMASCDIPEEKWPEIFNYSAMRERMRWVMEYDLFQDLSSKHEALYKKTSNAFQEGADSAVQEVAA
jgi:salicylate hydroxylase